MMVNTWELDERWSAPGALEHVRRLLNTAESPQPPCDVDRLVQLAHSARTWQGLFPDTPLPGPNELDDLLSLRSTLREAVDAPSSIGNRVAPWLEAHPVVARVTSTDEGGRIHLEAADSSVCGHVLAIAVGAIADRTWNRLRSCPDCRLYFFDRSRNSSKRWCGMYAGETGRSCGSIAKVRRWRERHVQATIDG